VTDRPAAFDVWHVAIPVADLERSLAWYRAVGFVLAGRDQYPSKRQAFVATRPGGFTIELFQPSHPPAVPGRPDHLAFECHDIAEYRRHLLRSGIAAPEIERFDNGVLTFTVEDPDGVRLDFFQGRAIYDASIRPSGDPV
jgi:catechol 2,3-dioxygenase-like lactoylglutathione lyase family enzyme